MLKIEDSLLIIVDAQGNLARVVAESEAAISRIQILTRAAAILGLPVLLTAQSPHKIGHTIAEIASLLPEQPELARTSFSVLADESCRLVLKASGRRQLLLCGFETHICVYQSAAEMLAEGCEVYIIADAVSSRQQSDKQTALHEISRLGGHVLSAPAQIVGINWLPCARWRRTVSVPAAAYVQSSMRHAIQSIDEQIKQMEVEIDHLIDQEEEWQSRIACMTSCKGVGKVTTTATLLAEMPELGHEKREQIAAFGRGSSYEQGQRQESGRRKTHEAAGANCGVFCLWRLCRQPKFNPVIHAFYQRLIEKRENFDVVMVACMHKLLTILNTMLRKNEMWRPDFA